jgi:TatA/E family protein of Tat protein translocase
VDFFGFHPMYVVILLALALIIFGPSRLPKMGAQVGRMLREFQAAREGLTQQMREAFEEEPNFGSSTGPTVAVAEEAPASEPAASTEGAVAVADRPLGETIAAGILDPSTGEEVKPEEQEAAGAAGATTPEIDLTEVAAAKSPATEATPEGGDVTAAASVEPSNETTAEEPESAVTTPDPAVHGVVPEASATGGIVVDSPAEEAVAEHSDAELDAHDASVTSSPGTVVEAPQQGELEAPPPAGGTLFASVSAEHQGSNPPRDEEARPD